jgi:hypothetical protein
MGFLRRHRVLVVLVGHKAFEAHATRIIHATPVLIPTLYVMFEERFPRTIAPIEVDGAPPRREAHPQ